MNVGVLASGRGSNLRRLVELDRAGRLGQARVVAVASNRATCGAVEFAQRAEVPVRVFPQRDFGSAAERDSAMASWLDSLAVELVVLAGYDRVLNSEFTSRFPGRIVNVHPSLLPAFAGGMNAVVEALEHGVKVTGCTVHLLGDEVDGGPILLQAPVPVLPGDTPTTLHERIQAEEHRLVPEAVKLLAAGLVTVKAGRAVIDERQPVG